MNTKDLMEMGADLAREEYEASKLQGDARRYGDVLATIRALAKGYEYQPTQQKVAWLEDIFHLANNALNPKPKTDVPCPVCQGRGDVEDSDPMRERTQWIACRTCGGTGRMTLEEHAQYKAMNAHPSGRWTR